MCWRWLWLALLVTAVASKGKKHRRQKPGRAELDRLTSTTVSEGTVAGATEGLVPAPLDVAPYAIVTANATCGDTGSEEYCRDTPGKRSTVCDVCEGTEGSSSRRHPPSHAVDGDAATWWQSPTIAAGEEYHHVELVATLPAKMELLHVIIKAGASPRPLAWSLEVSSSDSGEDWRMVRAFGDRDHCRKLWDLRPERRRRKVRASKRTSRAEKITCSTQFASLKPLENGEMHVGFGEGVVARRVRISFRAAHPSSPRHQYYTVRALTLAARCLCHGHAKHCSVDAQGAKCACLHGTCGSHCHRCCSGLPWAADRHCEEPPSECSCGERGACSYDDTGAILCVNCSGNRAGPLCDRCLFGYYNSASDGPCVPCACNPEGSDGSCKWDKKSHQLECTCFPGFTGARCDACEDPAAAFPRCQAPTTPACRCDPRGIPDPARACNDVCVCKANVVGERCDACAPGHFGLSGDLAEGCRPCYCSHVTNTCTLAEDSDPPRDILLPLGESWVITDAQANATIEPSVDEEGNPFVFNYEVEGWENFFWMTRQFSGEQLAAYGGQVRARMFWGVVRGDTGGNPTAGPDVVLLAHDGTMLAYANTSHERPGDQELTASLVEGSWYVWGAEPERASRLQLLDVLGGLRAIMLRAHFHFDQDEVRLSGAEVAGGGGGGAGERCACPPSHAGAHCQRCAWTHVRRPRATRADCLPCPCNGHASCDTVDGPCGACQHNTTGPHCERCLPGHYGNPVQGACKPCACPLYAAANNFSPNCALASAEGDDYVCTQCPDGYSGDHCETCDFGYWGSPTTVGSRCQACACGGSPCHPTTGECLTCPAHTEGARCDLCKEGYWADGSGACVACACGAGALSAACDARSGQCACRAAWAGRACDTCARGHGGLAAGCPVCRCGLASINNDCDPITGDCTCAPGAASPSCDTCLEYHYGLEHTGCKGCNCSSVGAESNVCDIRSGQCRCRPHVTGRACDTCEDGYWGLHLGGCRRCSCGRGAVACDAASGACACAPGVSGAHCDRCMPGYYGFGPQGCLPCPTCADGKVCSAQSGRCVCPAGALGAGCRQCARGHWAHPEGCRPCACAHGAVSNTCDPHTGECKCRLGWAGGQCQQCAAGHFGPQCQACRCWPAGTRHCRDNVCQCDALGRCPCKENVVGEKCTSCMEGTFALSAANPLGCTACFCFGRAARCEQAALARAALHAPAPAHLTLLQAPPHHPRLTDVDQDSLLAIHTHASDARITMPWPPVPVYMELDKRFLGDKITSYGGLLRFRVEEEGGEALPPEVLAKFPLVRLYGRSIVLDHYEHAGSNGSHAVRLHESLWGVRGRDGGASRGALLLALRRLDAVLLRVATRAPAALDPVHALLLNVSLDTAVPGLSRSQPALGVERCDCGAGYAASSCQQPALGFWMPPPTVTFASRAGTILINLQGDAQPCRCNNRTDRCHPDTGDCLNCTAGTGGPRCDECAPGHYGSPEAPEGCQPCPCPTHARNFAMGCTFVDGRLQCLCKTGYTGARCEACAAGWVRAAGGACEACGCHPRGAASARCDERGCRCKPHAAGPRCDRCLAPRTYMTDAGCTACDNCTQTLLNSIEELSLNLRTRANPTELSRIPKPFPALREFAHNTSSARLALSQIRADKSRGQDLNNLVSEAEDREHKLFTEANRIKTEALKLGKEAEYLNLESTNMLEEIGSQRKGLESQVAELDDFARGERHLSAHRALKEARHLLRLIKDMKLIDYLAGANDVFELANVQSTAVQEYNYKLTDSEKRLRRLREALETWEVKAQDLPKLGGHVWTAGDELGTLQETVRPRLSAVRDIGLRCRLVLEDITSLSTHNITDEVRSSLLRSQGLVIKFPSMAAELAELTLAAEQKEGILYNLTPQYRDKYLNAVQNHVAELSSKAKTYAGMLSGSRWLGGRGVAAAQGWARVAAGVRGAAQAAADAARAAAAAAALARGPVPLPLSATRAINASAALRDRGAAVLAKAEALGGRLEAVRRAADVVRVGVRGLGWRERALGAAPRARVAPLLHDAEIQAERVFATTRVLYDEASEIRSKVRYTLRRQLADLQRLGDTALGAAQEHVSQIRGNTERGAQAAAALGAAAEARAQQRRAAGAALAPNVLALRERLARARDAAASISVSMTSVPGAAEGCARAYAVSAASPSVTRLALAVSFDAIVRDGPLLYLLDHSQDKERYMELSVENRKLVLTWDLGSGVGTILHPEELQPAHDDADHTSYRVEIERVWSNVRLVVERADTVGAGGVGGAGGAASNSSGAAGALAPRLLWLGRSPLAPLRACLHALHTDDATLGLWSFHHQPKDAHCTGCTQRAGGGRGGEAALAQFSGAGYAELRRTGFRAAQRRHFSVSFTFRTMDEHALLFMALDHTNNRSVSVVMRECRVVFMVEYGGGARLEIAAGGRHCDGRPKHVQAIRLFAGNNLEKGSLRVNGEETLGSPRPPVQEAEALPALGGHYWLGGAPPHAAAPAPPLLGCLGALAIDQQGYDIMDTPARHGVEPRCRHTILRSAILDGAGYIELASPIIRRKAAVGLSFRTRTPDGLLMMRTTPADELSGHANHYLAVMLVEGEVVAVAALGKGEIRLRTNDTKFHDGRIHTVRLVRAHKQLELWVDEQRVGRGVVGGGALPAAAGGLFLGGLAPTERSSGYNFSLVPYTGTVADVIVDGQLLGVEGALRWAGAQLGRAHSELPQAPRPLKAQPAAAPGCTKTPSYTVEAGAVKFGDAARSHATLAAGRRRELSVAMHFRTFRPQGLLLVAPGSKAKPKHYMALMIRDGKLRLVVRGRKRKEVALTAFVADGTWRSVVVRVGRSRLGVWSGGEAGGAPGGAAGRAARLYVGGAPAPSAAPHLPRNILKVGGFLGCIRRVTVNGRAEDLVRDAQAHHHVGQCFPNVEPGAYFGGDAHATWSSAWPPPGADDEGGEWSEIQLRFRTTEPSGVLLASGGLVLEVKDGAVVLSQEEGGQRRSVSSAEGGAGGAGGACDGAWHGVWARAGGGGLRLRMDAAGPLRAAPPARAARRPPPAPLYLAGLPESVMDSADGGRENFKGCMRDVVIGGRKLDWSEMESLHNVLLDSCPIQE